MSKQYCYTNIRPKHGALGRPRLAFSRGQLNDTTGEHPFRPSPCPMIGMDGDYNKNSSKNVVVADDDAGTWDRDIQGEMLGFLDAPQKASLPMNFQSMERDLMHDQSTAPCGGSNSSNSGVGSARSTGGGAPEAALASHLVCSESAAVPPPLEALNSRASAGECDYKDASTVESAPDSAFQHSAASNVCQPVPKRSSVSSAASSNDPTLPGGYFCVSDVATRVADACRSTMRVGALGFGLAGHAA